MRSKGPSGKKDIKALGIAFGGVMLEGDMEHTIQVINPVVVFQSSDSHRDPSQKNRDVL